MSEPTAPRDMAIDRAHGCVRKSGYPTRERAELAMRYVVQTHPGGDFTHLNVWACRYCGAWHVGNATTAWRDRGAAAGDPPNSTARRR